MRALTCVGAAIVMWCMVLPAGADDVSAYTGEYRGDCTWAVREAGISGKAPVRLMIDKDGRFDWFWLDPKGSGFIMTHSGQLNGNRFQFRLDIDDLCRRHGWDSAGDIYNIPRVQTYSGTLFPDGTVKGNSTRNTARSRRFPEISYTGYYEFSLRRVTGPGPVRALASDKSPDEELSPVERAKRNRERNREVVAALKAGDGLTFCGKMKISSDDGDYKYETELVLDRNGGSRISFVYDEDPSFFEKVFESVDHFGKGSLGRHIEGAITAYDPEKLSFKGRIVNKDGCPQSSVEFSGELSAVNGKPKVQAEGRGVLCLGAVTSAGARTVRLSFTLHECEGSGNTTGADCGMTDAVQIQTYIPGGSEGHKAGASGWMRVGPIPASQYSMAKSYIATSLAGISADDYTTGTPRTYKRTEPSIGIIEIYQVDPCKEDTWGYGGVVSENYAAPKYKVSISGAKAIEYLEKEMQTRKGAP